ncbi:MAG: hypothetical protein ACYS26_21750 [Planctomycetota bacterium]|jgi:hypothetical protein
MDRELKSILTNLGESTAKSYKGSYMRLRRILDLTDRRKPIKKMSLDIILDKIKEVENPSTRHSVFVIVKKIFDYESNKDKLDEVDKQIRTDKRDLQIKKNGHLNKSLPTYKELNDALKKETNAKKYITSFLMLKVSTRNQDIAMIDLHRTNDNHPLDIEKLDKERNHVVVTAGSNKAIYIRNVYKTSKKYGQKKNIITVKKFIDMVREELGDEIKKSLFIRKNGDNISNASIGSYLKRYVILGLNEGQIMKVVLKHIDDRGSYDMLRKVSSNRGTNIATLLAEYDVTNIKPPSEIISQDQETKQDVDVSVVE